MTPRPQLRQECALLRQQLSVGELNHRRKMSEFEKEEKHIREENLRLQRKLQLEMERREALCRHLRWDSCQHKRNKFSPQRV